MNSKSNDTPLSQSKEESLKNSEPFSGSFTEISSVNTLKELILSLVFSTSPDFNVTYIYTESPSVKSEAV